MTDIPTLELVRQLQRDLDLHKTHDRGYSFVPLTTPLYFNWNGASTVIPASLFDLSTTFGLPDNIKAVYISVWVKDSAAWGSGTYFFACGPSASYYYASVTGCYGGDITAYSSAIVPCDANGNMWYWIYASGAGTLDFAVNVWGYWI